MNSSLLKYITFIGLLSCSCGNIENKGLESFKNNNIDSIISDFHKNGKTNHVVTFFKNSHLRRGELYSKKGNLFLETISSGKTDLRILLRREDNGFRGVFFYKEKQKNGPSIILYKNSRINYLDNYCNNLQQGYSYEFDTLGRIISWKLYKDNRCIDEKGFLYRLSIKDTL